MAYLIVILLMGIVFIVSSRILKIFHIPFPAAIILTGMYFGPYCLNVFSKFIDFLGETERGQSFAMLTDTLALLGTALMFFYLAEKISFNKFREEKRGTILFSIIGITVPGAAGFFLGLLLKMPIPAAFLLSAVFISLPFDIVSCIMADIKAGKSKFCDMIKNFSFIADITSVVLLYTALSLSHLANNSLLIDSISVFNHFYYLLPWANFLLSFAGFAAYAAVFLFFIPFLINYLNVKMNTGFNAGPFYSIFIVFLAMIGGEFLGINVFIGAFTAGLSIAISFKRVPETLKINELFESPGLILVLSFVYYSIGANIKPGLFLNPWNLLVVIIIFSFLFISRFTAFSISGLINGFKPKDAVNGGIISLSFFTMPVLISYIGKIAGILSMEVYSSIIFICVASIIFAPPLFKWYNKINRIRYEHADIRLNNWFIHKEEKPDG